jgi:enoyl-CoA hydratase/carnithine racemase
VINLIKEGAISRLLINRPASRNAMNRELMSDLRDAARAVSDDTSTRVVVIEAAGSDFSVGADIAELQRMLLAEQPSLLAQRREVALGADLVRAIREIEQPTICAIQGVATGAGACIATASDFRLVAADARVGYGEVRLGMNLMWGALPGLIELIGSARAKRMVMSGALFPAEQLAAWGWADEVCEAAHLADLTADWANQYAALPPIAVQMIKRSVNRYATALGEAVMHMDADQWLLAASSHDFREAVTAFQEKRPPSFTGE